MIVFPKEKPVLANLNSYYLNLEKLVEHFQGEIGAGAIFLRAAAAKGVVFFDPDNVVNVFFQSKKDFSQGVEAYNTLLHAAYNFIVDIYQFELEKVYFWAQMPAAKRIYRDVDTDTTDFNKLLKKIGQEKFTGYFEISLKGKLGDGLLFLNAGDIIGASCLLPGGEGNDLCRPEELLRKIAEAGATFNIFTFSFNRNRSMARPVKNSLTPGPESARVDVLRALSEMINTFEGIIRKEKSYDFMVLLKQKFVDKSIKYDFLDPFISELSYEDGTVTFTGSADYRILSRAVVEVVMELADELGKREHLLQRLHVWRKKYGQQFSEMGIKF